jgi:hypothetical protein
MENHVGWRFLHVPLAISDATFVNSDASFVNCDAI